MTSEKFLPTSLSASDFKLFRKTAKLLKKTNGTKHADALEQVAKSHGFSCWEEVVALEKTVLKLKAKSDLPKVPEEIPTEEREKERTEDLREQVKLNLSANREFLSQKGIDYSIFEPTGTGLKKSILDATQQVRTLFELKGFHNYQRQGKGAIHKIKKDAFFVTDSGLTPSTVSLYRPETKDGDPRMWFKGLPNFAKPGDQVAIVILNDCPYLLLMSTTRLEESRSTNQSLNALIESFTKVDGPSAELLVKLREIAKTPIHAPTAGDTAIGMAVEKALGILPNSSKKPDYKGIELKAGRSNKVRSNLFAQVPDWNLSQLKSSGEILNKHGYERDKDFRLYCTIRAGQPNSQGLLFQYDDKNDILEEIHIDGSKVASWPGNLLRGRLKEKHRETFWIKATSEIIDGVENFHLKSVVHTKSPLLNQLMPLIASGVITMDHLIKRDYDGRVKEKGPLFKIDKTNLKLLFPAPVEYSLVD